MKKRFTRRTTRQYLLSKLPENLFPDKTLKQTERRYLLKSHSFAVGQGSDKEKPLSYTIARETAKLRKMAICNKEKRWSEIDTLEQGPPSVNPPLINLADYCFRDKMREQSRKSLDQSTHRKRLHQSHNHSTHHLQSEQVGDNIAFSLCLRNDDHTDKRLVKTALVKEMGRDKIDNRGAGRNRLTTELLTSTLEIKGAVGRQDTDRSSPLLQQIAERRKIRILYGNLSNNEINTIAQIATTMRGERSQNIFKLIESRLDVVLHRGGMFPSIPLAQQWIRRGSIVVNGRIETVASRMLAPGDVVLLADNLLPSFLAEEIQVNSVKQDNTSRPRSISTDFSNRLSGIANRPTHIEVSYRSLSIVYLCHTQNILLPAAVDIAQARKAYTK
jgi:ribosomal protein S4